MAYEVSVREVPPRTVLRRRAHLATGEVAPFLQRSFQELYGLVQQRRMRPAGPPMVVFEQRLDRAEEADIAVWVPVAPGADVPEDVDVSEVPGGPVAVTTHRGPYEGMGEAYRAVDEWIAAHGREAVGPLRESYLNGPPQAKPSDYLTEVEVPLRA